MSQQYSLNQIVDTRESPKQKKPRFEQEPQPKLKGNDLVRKLNAQNRNRVGNMESVRIKGVSIQLSNSLNSQEHSDSPK